MKHSHLALICWYALLQSCNSGTFTSDGASKESTAPEPVEQPEIPKEPDEPEDCASSDFAKLKYPDKIQACIDQGKLFNFDSDVCTHMPEASFTCTFENVIAELDSLGLRSSGVKKGQDAGARLIACGQANDGLTIVAQWWLAPEGAKCEFKKGNTVITTGCYKKYTSEAPELPSNKEEERKFVLACMNES